MIQSVEQSACWPSSKPAETPRTIPLLSWVRSAACCRLQVLNSFQMASLLVQAYPAVPDALAVASAVIADMNNKGQALPSALADMQSNQGLPGLSMAAPLLCPASDHNPNAPSTAAAAAAAAAAAGVSQGASIGLGVVGQNQQLPLLQTLHGVGTRDALAPPGAPTGNLAAAAVDSLLAGQLQ